MMPATTLPLRAARPSRPASAVFALRRHHAAHTMQPRPAAPNATTIASVQRSAEAEATFACIMGTRGAAIRCRASAEPGARAPPSTGVDPLANATTIFPTGQVWAWQKAAPKPSAVNATAPVLNVIEALHWLSFPLGFSVAWYAFLLTPQLAENGFNGDPSCVFLYILGILTQTFGGSTAILMHIYEGWQIAQFRNPLLLPPSPVVAEVEDLRVPRFNNAWLRAAAYQMLISFQALGLSFISTAAFGIGPLTAGLVAGTALIPVVGPHEPRTTFKVFNEPIFPVSWALFIVLLVNVLANVVAYKALFGDALAADPVLAALLPHDVLEWLPILTPLLTGAGGAIEGAIAESTFDQLWHLAAFIILLLGLSSNFFLLSHLAA